MSYEPIQMEKELALRLVRALSGLTVCLTGQEVVMGSLDLMRRRGCPEYLLKTLSQGVGEGFLEEVLLSIRKVYPDDIQDFYKDVACLCNKILEVDPMMAVQFTEDTGFTMKDLEDSLRED